MNSIKISDKKRKIAILLSTYNGEMFIEELMSSLLNQTYRDFVIIVRDDNSDDKTLEILRIFRKNFKNIIIFFDGKNLGPKLSYSKLLKESIRMDFDYFMFADQDDIWLPEKVEKTLVKMIKLEESYSGPILIHTNLKVTDINLNVISKSFWHYQNINPHNSELNRILLQNIVTGCTSMINRSLAEISIPIPKQAIMHDWWLSLVASTFGKIDHIDEPTILYRQHSKNTVGAIKYNFRYFYKKIREKNYIYNNINQANEFYKIYNSRLTDNQKEILESFIQLQKEKTLNRIKIIFKHKFFKTGIVRNLGFILTQFYI